jgi:hypothetical protein
MSTRDRANEGIVQSGGSIVAGNLAVGRGAVARGDVRAPAQETDIAEALRALRDAVAQHGAGLADPSVVASTVDELQEEAEKEQPDRFRLRGLLELLSEAGQSVGGIAAAVTAVKVALGGLL